MFRWIFSGISQARNLQPLPLQSDWRRSRHESKQTRDARTHPLTHSFSGTRKGFFPFQILR